VGPGRHELLAVGRPPRPAAGEGDGAAAVSSHAAAAWAQTLAVSAGQGGAVGVPPDGRHVGGSCPETGFVSNRGFRLPAACVTAPSFVRPGRRP
jgi:hypothetical protein